MSFKAEYVIKNANILTMDKNNPTASAMAVWQDRILGVGKNEDFDTITGPGTKVWDLKGKTVLPGLNDNHSHPMYVADALTKVDVTGTASHEEFFAKLRARAETTPAGEWIEGCGYDEGLFAEKREPNLEEMDRALPNHPVFVVRACMHVGLANSLALKAVGINENTPHPPGGEIVKDENGRMTGRLCEAASFVVRDAIPPSSLEKATKAIEDMGRMFNALGITSTTEMGMLTEQPDEFEIWGNVRQRGNLKVRIAGYYLGPKYRKLMNAGLPLPLGDDMFRYQGRKILLDGGGGSGTARMSQPNNHDGKYGILYFTQEELDDIVWEAHSKGQQIAAHGIGDVAITMILDSYQKAQKKLPRPDARHRIEHCSFCFPHLVERVIQEGVLPLMHPGFLYYFGETHTRNYGPERVAMEFPFRSLLDGGIVVGNGSDSPVTIPDPRPIIYESITRISKLGLSCGEKERITPYEAIYSYTAAGAYMTFDENKKGKLCPGMFADFIVTDIDPTACDPAAILSMRVERTVLGGKTVFQR